MRLEPGVLLDHYRLIAPIGEGGMGVVWKALDTSLDREVALKLLPDALAKDPDRLAMFEHEARTLAALSHPNIVTIYAVEQCDGRRFLSMELIDGEPLSALIPPEGLPLERVVDLALPVVDALAAAHQRGVTHRDVKPANIVVARDGRVKVLDFGVATLVPGSRKASRAELRTWGGSPLPGAAGTLAYMSPEQVTGDATDPRSDLFSLGSVLFEMATGHRPFDARTPVELIATILRDPPDPPTRWNPNLPDVLVRVITTCLEKDPKRRPASALDVRRALDRLESDLKAGRQPARRSIAVLAPTDLSPGRDQQYFCEGLAGEIIHALTRVRGLHVASRLASFRFDTGTSEIPEIGRALQVSTLLDGTVRRVGSHLRVTAELVDATSGFCLWSDRYDRDVEDVFAILNDIARQIAEALTLTFTTEERDAAQRSLTRDVRAYDLYLRGRQLFARYNRRDAAAARERFVRALEIDPQFARAQAGLADCHSYLYLYAGRDPAHLDHAVSASHTAVGLDPSLAEAHAALGTSLSLSGHHEEAVEAFEAAIRLDPSHFEAHYFYARDCFAQGRLEQAVRLYEEASRLRPEDYQAPLLVAQIYDDLGLRREAEASRRLGVGVAEAHLRHEPDDARAWYMGANGLVALGERERGLEWARRALSLDPDDAMLLYNIACIYSMAGNRDEALTCLERARAAGLRQKGWLLHDSNLDAVRDDPRFAAIMASLE
jgi:serine/threonine protein kinase/tetratricopeptide (TPR) repeat protein